VKNPKKEQWRVDGPVALDRPCVATAVSVAIMPGVLNVVKMKTRIQMSRMNWKVAQVAFFHWSEPCFCP
jgi:hypothetical protein